MKWILYNVYLSPTIANNNGKDKYINEETSVALIVPFGIFCYGFTKSPDLLHPAIIPVTDGKKIDKYNINVFFLPFV